MKQAHNVPVLMYHHVTPRGGMIAATPQVFEQQIVGLARAGYRSLDTGEFIGHLQGRPVPAKSVLITFDDGYLDNWVHAHPVLQRYGMKAVLFVVTGWVADGPLRPHAGQGPVPEMPDHDACKRLIEQGGQDEVMARWSELQAMRAAGTFEIHSHTHTHTRWDKLYAQDAARKCEMLERDLALSRQALAQHMGAASDQLCWPQGYFDADYLRIAEAAGFRYLYTTDALGQNVAGTDPRHIHRFAVSNRGGSWLLRRLALVGHPYLGARYHAWKAWKKRRRSRS